MTTSSIADQRIDRDTDPGTGDASEEEMIVSRSTQSVPKQGARASQFPRDAGGTLLGDGFVSEATLEDWLRSGVASRAGAVLSFPDGRRYTLTDGLRILGRRNGDSDPYGLTGTVLTLRSVLRRGGLASSEGIRLGAAIYDVSFGVIAEPV